VTDPTSHLRRLAEYQQYGELEQACNRVQPGLNEPEVTALLALAWAGQGKVQAADAAMDKLSEPHWAGLLGFEAQLDIAGAYLLLFRMDRAKKILERIIAQQPDHPLALARYGWCLMRMGERFAAEAQFKACVRLDGSLAGAWANLATLALLREDIPAAFHAIEHGEAALSGAPDAPPESYRNSHFLTLHRLRLQCWVGQKAYARAEIFLEEAAKANEEAYYVALLCAYARALAEQERHAQAEDALNQGLDRYPDNIRLMSLKAEMARIQGHFPRAARLLGRAVKKDRENVMLWCELSSVCLDRFSRQAREAAVKAGEVARRFGQGSGLPSHELRSLQHYAKAALARVESNEGQFDRGEALFREILADAPYFVPALQGLGQQLMQQGRINEALAFYERMKTVDPVQAHTCLILARRFPEDEAVLKRMGEAARTPGMEGRVRAGILFPLAAAWEKRGAYDRAFEFARIANEASRTYIRYSRKGHRNYCHRVRTRFSRALFQSRRGYGLDTELPVYVVGMPRSGTTLVEQILSGHSRIFGAGELGLIPGRIQGLNRWERFAGSGRRYPDCVDDLSSYVTRKIAGGILEELQTYDPKALHVVDKLPHNFENIGFIKFLFPHAKIISVRRDPRDIAISNYFTGYQAKHGGMGFAYDLTDIGEHLADHNQLMYHWDQLFPGQILEIRYEDVVDDLEDSVRRMLDYIGVDFEPNVLDFNTLDRTVRTASLWQVRQPIYKTAKNRWKNYKNHLAPLIQGTNAKILPDPIEDMISLPVPGFLQEGVALFHKGDLDGAELNFKKMLHHNPDHAACTYMVGLIYCRKGHLADGARMMEQALEKAPWHREWCQNLRQAFEALGLPGKASELEARREKTGLQSFARDIPKNRQTWQVLTTPSQNIGSLSSDFFLSEPEMP
jgi:tetratricopeptide (TPR) repeat protein